mgnify:CR=1 FL=1
MINKNKDRGITLVALVITIIILLILATISIQSLTNTGLFKNAEKAREVTEEKTAEEKKFLDSYEEEMGIASGAKEYTAAKTMAEAQTDDMLAKKVNSSITDAYGNKITVPAGFKIKVDATTNNATTVNQGIVIVDSNENEFVWIPVGKIYTDVAKTDANAKTIELGRYNFDSSTGAKSAYSGSYVEEDKGDTNTTLKNYGNTIAKNITNFKNSVTTNGGYYIGRYEARTTTPRTAKGDALTQITEKGTDSVYNYVEQKQAAEQAQNMYNSNKFTSDLMNSYAWDTATLFLQTCGEEKYSIKTSVNKSLASKGTNSSDYTGTRDTVCNVYDMASNISEWSTETSHDSYYPCVYRGDQYIYSNYMSYRNISDTSSSHNDRGFRPLLYVNV